MEREPAFLDAIRANPQDEALRLIYADWLEEQGKSEQSCYLRLHNQLLTVIGAGQLGQESATSPPRLAQQYEKAGRVH